MGIESTETEMFKRLSPEKQQRITEAAVHEFAQKGYTNASMNVVVGRAEISKGALFKYFRSKSGLFAFVYRITLHQVKAYLRDVRDKSRDDNFFLRLEKIMLAGVNFMKKHPGLSRIYYRIVYTGESPYKKEILEELHIASLKFIQSLIEHAIMRGELRPDLNPRTAAFVIESVLDRFLQAHRLQFLDHSLNLYGATSEESIRWIQGIIELFKEGMERSE